MSSNKLVPLEVINRSKTQESLFPDKNPPIFADFNNFLSPQKRPPQLPAELGELSRTATNGEGVRRLEVLMGLPGTVLDLFLKSCWISTNTSTNTSGGTS